MIEKTTIPAESMKTPASTLPETYSLTFLQNRSFELKIGRKLYRFEPYQTIGGFTDSQINSADFKQQEKYFVVKKEG